MNPTNVKSYEELINNINYLVKERKLNETKIIKLFNLIRVKFNLIRVKFNLSLHILSSLSFILEFLLN